ncbi:regucalcin-like [Sitodiplosis mosellana]|uniref:regucalcin-like n=1 Tax=Sitodiplosis mosellana TaxID=263140 RepID=UPI002444B080|nr:regucalcin-like [Sitodiplosis mosellana]
MIDPRTSSGNPVAKLPFGGVTGITFGGKERSFGVEISGIAAPEVGLGVAAIWDDCTQSVYYVDFLSTGQAPSIFRYDYNEDKVYFAYILGQSGPSFILPIKECNKYKNLFAVGLNHYMAVIEWDGKSPVATVKGNVFSVEESDPTSRICVGRQGEKGRFYGGMVNNFCGGPSNSSFYMYSKEKGLRLLFTGPQVTTGVAFDEDSGYVYHIGSCKLLITAFQGDANGDICNGRALFDFHSLGYKAPDTSPIGLEADADGFLYTALYSDGSIWKIDPRTSSGNPIAQMPFNLVGSVTFGGPKRDILFVPVGTANIDLISGQIIGRNSPRTSLYKIRELGAKGRKYSRFIV